MSIKSRTLAAVLLTAALGVLLQGLAGPRARAHGPEFTRLCGPEVFPLGSNIQWDPPALEAFSKVFVVETTRYSPEEHRVSWTLRSVRSYPGPLGKAEDDLGEALRKATKGALFRALFYNDEGRKMGDGQLFIVPGERRPDGTFTAFADLSLRNAELIASKAVITLFEAARLYGTVLDFKVEPDPVELVPGGKAKLKVTVTNRAQVGYVDAPIDVEVQRLPKGVTAEKGTIPPDRNSVEIELTADPDAAEVTQKDARVKGTATLRKLQGFSPPFIVTVKKKGGL
jgi:hypothetical protein